MEAIMDILIREIQDTDHSDLVRLWNHDLGSPTLTPDNDGTDSENKFK